MELQYDCIHGTVLYFTVWHVTSKEQGDCGLLFEQFGMYGAVLVENYKNIKSGTSN